MRKPIRIEKLSEKDKEELYNAFAGKPHKFDKMPDISSVGEREFALVKDSVDTYLVTRKDGKLYKIPMTEV
jgi:hypothetical protein